MTSGNLLDKRFTILQWIMDITSICQWRARGFIDLLSTPPLSLHVNDGRKTLR